MTVTVITKSQAVALTGKRQMVFEQNKAIEDVLKGMKRIPEVESPEKGVKRSIEEISGSNAYRSLDGKQPLIE